MDQNTFAHFSEELIRESESFNYPLSSEKVNKLLEYLSIFAKWNKTYNLSAIRQPEEMLSKHLLDSLSIAPFLAKEGTGERFIDVGTGGGLPGIPMAICFPEKSFTLLDSAGKKTRFLFQVKQALKLDNVTVENRRVESFQPDQLFDGVISRAFASLKDMTDGCSHLLKKNGRFWAMKGVMPKDELSELAKHYIVDACHELRVPGNIGERCLVLLKSDRTD